MAADESDPNARRVVAVIVDALSPGFERLLRALREVFDVDFVVGDVPADGVIRVGGPADHSSAASAREIVFATAASEAADGDGVVSFARSELVDERLRGRRLPDRDAVRAEALQPKRDEAVLAVSGRRALWLTDDSRCMRRHVVALAPPELSEGQRLRDLFMPGKFQRLLPLIQFLREVTGYEQWERPPLRAAIVFDDPNLHWPTYGYVRYAELAEHAARVGYHVAMATIPLDAWYSHPRVVRIFRERRCSLSLCIHGNDHVHRELGSPNARRVASTLQQGLRRVRRLEAHGIRVDRVVVPPHGVCSTAALAAAYEIGVDAICAGGGTPADGSARVALGWEPASALHREAPVISRHHLLDSRDDVVFRAFLDQPVIFYGHHWDLADGLEILEGAVSDVQRIARAEWLRLGDIALGNYFACRSGTVLSVRAYSRRVLVSVPDGVNTLDVRFFGNARIVTAVTAPGPQLLEAEVCLAAAQERAGFVTPWPAVRRAATELRDRARPTIDAVRTARRGPSGVVPAASSSTFGA